MFKRGRIRWVEHFRELQALHFADKKVGIQHDQQTYNIYTDIFYLLEIM